MNRRHPQNHHDDDDSLIKVKWAVSDDRPVGVEKIGMGRGGRFLHRPFDLPLFEDVRLNTGESTFVPIVFTSFIIF